VRFNAHSDLYGNFNSYYRVVPRWQTTEKVYDVTISVLKLGFNESKDNSVFVYCILVI